MMKRLCLLLVLLLLLTGCTNKPTEPTQSTTAPTQPPKLEALMQYALPGNGMDLVGAMGDGLLFSDGSQLTLLSSDNGKTLASAVLENIQAAQSGDIQIGKDGVAFYDREGKRITFLDKDLKKTRYLTLPEQVQGSVLLTWDWSGLYYCTADGVHVLNLLTGQDRTIAYRQENWLGVNGIFMDDMISCTTQLTDGSVGTLIISTQNGATVFETGKVSQLSSLADLYFCKMTSAGVEEWVYGWGGDQPLNLWLDADAKLLPMLNNDQIVSVEDGKLRCFDLNSGCCIAELAYYGASAVEKVVSTDGGVFFTNGSFLYRWDLELTEVEDETSYVSYRYTLEDPDEDGLQMQQMSALMLEKLYGINIHMWNEVTAVAPKGYEFVIEYIPEEYQPAYEELENALDTFGYDFLKTAGSWKEESQLNIVLVRQIRMGEETLPGLQYILNGQVYIALAMGEKLEENFYHLMGHAVDTVVLRESLAFDDWEWLNPDDFVYGSSAGKDFAKYLEGKDPWFIDENSMTLQVEDRATILAHAILPDNEALFAGDALQSKLRMICRGIREAFDLTGEGYLWEQYLEEEVK